MASKCFLQPLSHTMGLKRSQKAPVHNSNKRKIGKTTRKIRRDLIKLKEHERLCQNGHDPIVWWRFDWKTDNNGLQLGQSRSDNRGIRRERAEARRGARSWGNPTSVDAEANLRNGITSHDSVDRGINKYRRGQKANDNIRGRSVDPWAMERGGRKPPHLFPFSLCRSPYCSDRITQPVESECDVQKWKIPKKVKRPRSKRAQCCVVLQGSSGEKKRRWGGPHGVGYPVEHD